MAVRIRIRLMLMVAAAAVLPSAGGCSSPKKADPLPAPEIPLDRSEVMPGTLGELIEVRNDAPLRIKGIGVVVGLGTNGHTTMHPNLREQVRKLVLARLKTGASEGFSTQIVSVDRLLNDPDTAVVQVEAEVPAGCRKGEYFDIQVRAWPGTDTKSLDGGILYTSLLHRVAVVGGDPVKGREIGVGGGALFVNPMALDAGAQKSAGADPKFGRVLGGGRSLENRIILLVLREPELRNCRVVSNRVNERFQEEEPIAKPRGDYNVEIGIPARYRDDVDHFLDLLMHLPLDTTPNALEMRARRLASVMAGEPVDALGDGKGGRGRRLDSDFGTMDLGRLSLALEGIGKPALPWLRPLVTDRRLRDAVRLAAAEAAARLGDAVAAEVLGEFAFSEKLRPESTKDERLAWQERAVRTLAGAVGASRGGAALQTIMRRHPNQQFRILAYEALRRRGDRAIQTIRVVSKTDLHGEARMWFDLDLVPKDIDAPALVYATQRDFPRIALFGPDMVLESPVQYLARREVRGAPRLTLFSRTDEPAKLDVQMWTRNGIKAPELTCSHRVADLIKLLGGQVPDTRTEEVTGLGMAYSEIVGLLHDLTRAREGAKPMLAARMELQREKLDLPELLVRGRRTLDDDVDDGAAEKTDKTEDPAAPDGGRPPVNGRRGLRGLDGIDPEKLLAPEGPDRGSATDGRRPARNGAP